MVTEFKKKQKRGASNHVLLKLGVLVIICICVGLVVINLRMLQKKNQLNQQVSDLKNKIEDLKENNTHLEEGISKSDDINYIEKVAREELDLQKPGEKVFSFVKAPAESEVQEPKKNSWPAWLGWVGGWFKK